MTRRYYLVDQGQVNFANLRMKTNAFGDSPKKESISHFYNFRSDPKLGLRRVAGRQIPYACQSCRLQLELEWENNIPVVCQPRYKQNRQCKLWDIFEGLNDWHIIDLKENADSSSEEMTQSQRLVVESWTDNLGPKIHEGQIGAQSSVDSYYLVLFTGEPFQANETTVLEGYEPPIEVEAGEMLVEGLYWNDVPRALRWFTPSLK
jgi:hypothetical protein